MEYINCPICGQNDTEILFIKDDIVKNLTNVICKNCSLVYTNPRPTKEEYREFHREQFLADRGLTSVEKVEPKLGGRDFKIKQTVYSFLEEYLKDGQNVLDVGCGYGSLLNILQKEKKINIFGIEVGDIRVKVAKDIFGLDIFYGTLEEFSAKPENHNKFDLIVMHHSLEHMPNPLIALEQVKALLKEGGMFYVAVPNVMNINKRPEKFFRLAHPFSFSPHSLDLLLKKSGFGVLKYNRDGGDPGGMELIATLGTSPKKLEEGLSYQEVIRYVSAVNKKFSWLRSTRDSLLFFLPQPLRIRLGRIIYKIATDWKIIFKSKK